MKRNYHDVGWNKVTRAKCDGGLGLRDLSVMNQACIMKLGCKILNNEEDMWCTIVRSKYMENRFNDSIQAKNTDSALWKAIVKTSTKLQDFGQWKIGDGNVI